ncbi:MAG: T9SS type A sorting domain-containing protein [Ignavibacteriae bacterium]|nr:T9SS type A sorting domain-containing protein [Ignavibacteriota bacterium]
MPSYYEVRDVKFFDANTGIMVFVPYLSSSGMLRTTNGGNNWTLINEGLYYGVLDKIDSTTVYTNAKRDGVTRIQRTYDKGLTWDSVSLSSLSNSYFGLSFINRDTGWISGANYMYYNCIWKTTNGGVTLVQLTDTTGVGNIFFYKNKVNGEYIGWHYSSEGDNFFWKTTNSGVNWFRATRPPSQYPGYFQFYNENTGWFTWNSNGIGGGIYKSTNGGINWISQFVPSGNGIHNTFGEFCIINLDTIYAGGGYKDLPGGYLNALIWKTTNGGINWGYQELDTSFHIGFCGAIDFINTNTGWAFQGHGVHTTNGGGNITFTAIHNNNEIVATEYILKQNYPNPFNPSTTIEFSLPKESYVKLKILDLSGKTVSWVVYDMLLYSGLHRFKIVEFEKLNLSSGIYFYQLEARDINTGKTNFTQSRKMILLK